MAYIKTYLFGKKVSKGTFDDFYDNKKYATMKEAYEAKDYVVGNYVRDHVGVLYIEAYHVSRPSERKYHKLIYQRPFAGVDVLDDMEGTKLAISLFLEP